MDDDKTRLNESAKDGHAAKDATAQGGDPEKGSPEGVMKPEAMVSRRDALIRAGWTVPVLVAATGSVAALSHGDVSHVDSHNDFPGPLGLPYQDIVHGDNYTDTQHTDTHFDCAHTDAGFADSYTDVAHGDTLSGGFYSDSYHIDEPHPRGPGHGDHTDHVAHVDTGGPGHADHTDQHTDAPYQDFHIDAPHSDTHHDLAHVDSFVDNYTDHTDVLDHTDCYERDLNNTHLDFTTNLPHLDTPHSDTQHGDVYTDIDDP